ncbi:ATP-dependent helicase [Candidatus Dojkabacteria bacterium]|nr:ATP-dependent helicase [Candidatus Dojkabacteria bacterium]
MLDLNKNQLSAVKICNKPLIINAGPGTGKTKTLISKVKYLIDFQIFRPSEIAVLTFTNKAAKELVERLEGEKVGNMGFVGTFHGLAFRELTKSSVIMLIPSQIRKNIILELVEGWKVERLKLKDVELAITRYKNALDQNISDEFKLIVEKYAAKLKELGFVDFDDLLIEFNKSFHSNTNNNQVQDNTKKFRYILVDEFQDTNDVQYEILKKLSTNLCVIGDPSQSIYGFRGANSNIFDTFKKDFENHTEILLDTNYRSAKEIIECSHCLFPESQELINVITDEGSVKLIHTLNEYSEADYIIQEISKRVGGLDLNQSSDMHSEMDEKFNLSDFAIIYRTHSIGKVLEEKFNKSGIPFQIVGEGNVFESKEFMFIYNCLKYIYTGNPDSFVEIIGSRFIGCSKDLINKLRFNTKMDFVKRIRVALDQKELSVTTSKKLYSLLEFLSEIVKKSKQEKLSEIAKQIVQKFEIFENIKKEANKYALQQVLNDLIRFDRFNEYSYSKYEEYVENIKINEGYDIVANKVTLMTIHASKGLEFKYVFICGFEEGIIPFQKAIEEGSIEEEKRLLYVAMTRAKNALTLIQAESRNKRRQLRSQFLELLENSKHLKFEEDKATKKLMAKSVIKKLKRSQIEMF